MNRTFATVVILAIFIAPLIQAQMSFEDYMWNNGGYEEDSGYEKGYLDEEYLQNIARNLYGSKGRYAPGINNNGGVTRAYSSCGAGQLCEVTLRCVSNTNGGHAQNNGTRTGGGRYGGGRYGGGSGYTGGGRWGKGGYEGGYGGWKQGGGGWKEKKLGTKFDILGDLIGKKGDWIGMKGDWLGQKGDWLGQKGDWLGQKGDMIGKKPTWDQYEEEYEYEDE